MPGQRELNGPLYLFWVTGVRVFRCNLPPALLAEWPGSFTCHCTNMGVERTPSKSQHTKLTLEKKSFPPLLPGFELATFRSRVQRSHQQAMSYQQTNLHTVHLSPTIIQSNTPKSNVLGENIFLRVIGYLTYPSTTHRSNFAERTLTFCLFVCFLIQPPFLWKLTDPDINDNFFPCISCS